MAEVSVSPRRRGRLAGLLAAFVVLLTGCGGSGLVREPFLNPGDTAASPSGAYVVRLAQTGSGDAAEYTLQIATAAGAVVWSDDENYTRRHFPAIAWEPDADVLWIISSDLGNSSVRAQDGAWTKTFGSDSMPAKVRE